MPDFRTDLLPAGDWLYNPFFDPDVQSVLELKRAVALKCQKEYRVFLQAWPILVFEISGELSSEVSDVQRHSDWFSCYHLDRQFSADLLAAITRFVWLPQEKWDLRRALIEFANASSPEFSESWFARFRGEDIALPPHELASWEEVAGKIEVNCPHLKSVWLSGERLRKKEFYTEKKRRELILRMWRQNFAAYRKYGRTKWYERMPCLPG